MMAFEKRWARALLAAFAPSGGAGLSPRGDEVDYLRVFARMRECSTRRAALGLRLALWIAALAPLWLWGKLTTINKLAAERRAELLGELLGHRAFVVRELTLLLKLCAAMALLGTPALRARSGYDPVETASRVESDARVRLPLVSAEPPRAMPAVAEVSAAELPLTTAQANSEAPP